MDTTAILIVLGLVIAALLAALIAAVRSIQHALKAQPNAQLTTGIVAVQSEQNRVAQELGRAANAISGLQGTQQNLDSALRVLAGQASVRAEADAQSSELLRRLELVIAGSFHRGAAGENLLEEVLSILPPGMLEQNVRLSGGVVEFAVRLPGGKFIPIDSKWPAAQILEQIAQESDQPKRRELIRELENQVEAKAAEVAKYLDPERTILLGIAAVPDAVYHLCRAVHAQAYLRGVVLLPYSLAVPYALSMLVLIARFGGALDTSQVRASIGKMDQTLRELEDSLESHMSRGLTMFANALQNQRSGIAECRSIVAALQARADSIVPQEENGGAAITSSTSEGSGLANAG